MEVTDRNYDVIVVGGGASGMMAAGRSAEMGKRVLLIEKNNELGRKLKITGGGRCNITNVENDVHVLLSHYGKAKDFLYSSFARFGVKDTFEFFESRGLPLIVEDRKRAFPKTESALDVFKVLDQYLKSGNVTVLLNVPVDEITVNGNTVTSITSRGKQFTASDYILATGGKSHPETGSTGDGFNWLRDLGLKVTEPSPTVVPIAVRENWIKELAGVTFNSVRISFYVNNTRRLSLEGDILCTHFGISGPLILNSAGRVKDLLEEGTVTALIDIYPKLDEGTLDKKLRDVFEVNKNKDLKNIFNEFGPVGSGPAILPLFANIDPDKKVHSITVEERKMIAHILKHLPLTIKGLMGFERAVVTDGGVDLTEIDTRNMRVKRYKNLYITGDLLDIRRPSGGYSLQLCWTTGFIAGSATKTESE